MSNLRNVTYPNLVTKYGPGSKYQWVNPQANGQSGHFRYTRANGTANNASFNIASISGFTASPKDRSELFAKLSGIGATTVNLPSDDNIQLPKCSPFGWSHEGNMWIYKHPETGAFFESMYAPAAAAAPAGGRRRRSTRRRSTRRH